MNLFRLLLELFVLYLLYKLIFDLIIPVYRTTKHIKKNMDSMADKMNRQQEEKPVEKRKDEGEYIDYEEVK